MIVNKKFSLLQHPYRLCDLGLFKILIVRIFCKTHEYVPRVLLTILSEINMCLVPLSLVWEIMMPTDVLSTVLFAMTR
jgi:hypothetical protein